MNHQPVYFEKKIENVETLFLIQYFIQLSIDNI